MWKEYSKYSNNKTNHPVKNGQKICTDSPPKRYMDGKQVYKKMLELLIIREMLIKLTMRNHYTAIGLTVIKRLTIELMKMPRNSTLVYY